MLGFSVARRGFKVLFLERGKEPGTGAPPARGLRKRLRKLLRPDSVAEELAAAGRWDRKFSVRRRGRIAEFYGPMGVGPGGSSAVYGAALERFRREDFVDQGLADDPNRLSVGWPITYDDFLPYYRQAEQLFRLRGTNDPTDLDDDATLLAPPPLSERDAEFFDSFTDAGLSPYRIHVGIDYRPGCAECMGFICPRQCKSDAASRALFPALKDHGAKLLIDFSAERILADATHASAVVGTWRGRRTTVRGSMIVLAAGALNTPLILLNSACGDWPNGIGNQHDLVGRGLTFHVSEFFALWPRNRPSDVGPTKTLSSRAMNVVDGVKLGSFQSVGPRVAISQIANFLAGAIELNLPFRVPLLRLSTTAVAVMAAPAFRGAALFSTITEDFPYRNNRVIADANRPSGFLIEYEKRKELRSRVRQFRAFINRILKAHRPLFLTTGDNLNYGHPSGTARFGNSPEESVLTPENRVRGLDNLYVADASFFPSSAATNPSLTIAANALRVGGIIAAKL
ncbi:MAG TPA: GMC family oxidoreductase [Caulobacteraceae bacterium]